MFYTYPEGNMIVLWSGGCLGGAVASVTKRAALPELFQPIQPQCKRSGLSALYMSRLRATTEESDPVGQLLSPPSSRQVFATSDLRQA